MKIAIIYDSITLLTKEEAKEIDAHLVPLLMRNEKQEVPDDGSEASRNWVLENINANVKLQTSQSSPRTVFEEIEKIADKYDKILFFPLGKALSGQYQTLKSYEDMIPKLKVIDTDSGLMPLANTLKNVRKMLNKGSSIEEVEKYAKEVNKKNNIYIMFDRLDGVIRGGRASRALKSIVKILNLKAVLEFKNDFKKLALATKFDGLLGKLSKVITKNLEALKSSKKLIVTIYNGMALPKLIESTRKMLVNLLGVQAKDVNIVDMPSFLLVHSLNNCVGISIEQTEE